VKQPLAVLLLIVGLIAPTALHAQYDNEPVEYELPDRLNTIGINLTPGVLILMNGDPVRSHFGIMYKRQTRPNQKWRFQLGYEIVEMIDDERQDVPLEWSDTTITFNYRTLDQFRTDIRVGTEFFKPNAMFTMVYGFDAMAGIDIERESRRTSPFYDDPEAGGFVPSPFVAPTSYSQEVTYTYVGADFSIGQKITVREHLNFILQWTPELRYRWPVAETYSDFQQRDSAPVDDITFDFRGIELFVNVVF
jgi:hypothetical protein